LDIALSLNDDTKMKKCISISILDFSLLASERNHSILRLCDEQGVVFTDLLELHVIELGKKLGNDVVDDWIRLFNAKGIEDLDMIKTKKREGGTDGRRISMSSTGEWSVA